MRRLLVVCTTDSMIWNFLIPHIKELEKKNVYVECACSKTGFFFDAISEQYGIKMNEIPFKRSPYKISNYSAYKKLSLLIKEKQFDTIFCHEPVGGAIGRLAGKKNKCKVVYMAHGFHFYKGAPKKALIYHLAEWYLSFYTDILITINNEDYFASKNLHAKRQIKLNGIGVDTNKFEFNGAEADYIVENGIVPRGGIVFLSVGELIERKNHEVFIKAVAKLNNPCVYYLIAGDGELKSYLSDLINEFGLDKNVLLLGYRTDIKQLLNASDIFVMPSLQEGLSVALMEAMGCSKPVICSRIRGNIDLIDDNKGGFLCDVSDIGAYVTAAKMLTENKELCRSFGLHNQKKIKEYDVETIKKELVEILMGEAQ